MKQFFCFLLLYTLTTGFGYGQNYIDPFQFYYSNTPLNQFDSSLHKTRVLDFALITLVPIKLNAKTNLLTGADFEWMHTDLTPSGSSGSAGGIILKLGVNYKLTPKWTANFIFLPRMASDFKKLDGGVSREDFQFGGTVLFKYEAKPNLRYKFMLYYNSELFGPFISPIIGLYYLSPNQKFETDLSLPFLADINYSFKPKLFAGLKFQAFIRTYNLHDSYYKDNGEYLAKTSNELYTYLGIKLKNGLVIKANLGYSVGRNFRLYEIHDKVAWGLSAFRFEDDRKQLNADFSDGLLFRIDCIYRFYFPK